MSVDAFPGTERGQSAGVALGVAGMTDLPAVKYHLVSEHRPVLFWDEFHQVGLDLHRLGVRGQSHAEAQPTDVGIYGNAGRVEGVAEDDIGGCAGDSRRWGPICHRPLHFAAVVFNDLLTAADDASRLVAEEAG